PATNREVTTSASFRRELIEKIRQLGARRKRSADVRARIPAAIPAGLARAKIALADAPSIAPTHGHSSDFKLRPFGLTPPRALLIGSSTGGPQALTALVTQLAPGMERAPVLSTPLMPPTFTTSLAEHLAHASGLPA